MLNYQRVNHIPRLSMVIEIIDGHGNLVIDGHPPQDGEYTNHIPKF